jgi:hypothetical protein
MERPMAKIQITKRWMAANDLPPICMRCGNSATVYKQKQFSWHPSWVIVLILVNIVVYIIVALALTKRLRLDAPLCQRHRNHWLGRGLVTWLSLLALICLIIASAIELPEIIGPGNLSLIFFGGLFAFVAWVIMAVILQQTSIRTVMITDEEIALVGVAPEFKEAMLDATELSEERLDEARVRWKDRRRRDYDNEESRIHPGRRRDEEDERLIEEERPQRRRENFENDR